MSDSDSTTAEDIKIDEVCELDKDNDVQIDLTDAPHRISIDLTEPKTVKSIGNRKFMNDQVTRERSPKRGPIERFNLYRDGDLPLLKSAEVNAHMH